MDVILIIAVSIMTSVVVTYLMCIVFLKMVDRITSDFIKEIEDICRCNLK